MPSAAAGYAGIRTESKNLSVFQEGIRDGIPIAMGYFAVSFSLGIAAAASGLTPFQGFLSSILCHASAGEYAGFSIIGAGASYLEMALLIFVANARYLLMSLAESQRMAPGTPLGVRSFFSFFLTDELFARNMARPGYLSPYYTLGNILTASPCWAFGTALGCMAGDLLPLRLTSALGVALYGMFLAVIIPQAKESRLMAGLIVITFALSCACQFLPGISSLSEGTRVIIITVAVSSLAAYFFPRKVQEPEREPAASAKEEPACKEA